jgi:ectoine hydroxylase-related dioxygenase (phytanoyl-CoA dioxygenase family)
MQPETLAANVERDGFSIVTSAISEETRVHLIDALESARMARSTRGGEIYGARNLLEVPAIAASARSEDILPLAETVLGTASRPVRGIFFDKTPQANWPVPWHQDLTIAVAERHELERWTHWSVKAGAHHVQPPTSFLERMVTLRLHLDDCGASNGPLRVLPGSHRLGRLSRDQITLLQKEREASVCCAPALSALVMRPLLLHASSPATNPSHRRVIHIEFAPEGSLPSPLRWL